MRRKQTHSQPSVYCAIRYGQVQDGYVVVDQLFMYSPLFVCVFGPLCLSLFWYALLCVLSRVPIILKRKILFLLSHPCIAILYVLWLCLTVPWVGLQCVIVVFPGHNRFLLHFTNNKHIKINFI